MAQRFYSTDDEVNLDWIDVDIDNPIQGVLPGRISYNVVSQKTGNTGWKLWKSWINTKENPAGVWHETPQGVAKQLRAKAREIQKIPVHPF